MKSQLMQKLNKVVVSVVIAAQVLFVFSALLIPKPAKALFGIADFTFVTKIADPYDVMKDVGIAAARQIALRAAETFLTRFTDKLVEKYKIRNFLYYDQVLTDYYLGGYIMDKISDPDLRQIYAMLQAGYITGTYTGTTGGPDPRNALIPRLKQAISDWYIKQGGVDPSLIENPPATMSDMDYFTNLQRYAYNPPSYTEQNLRAQFGAFQSAATTASQLEILVGNGLKAGRYVGGTCSVEGQNTSPSLCAAAGGQWQPSVLDKARSFIDNPTAFVDGYLTGAIKRHLDNNFNPEDYWAVIGSLVGNFLFNRLTLDDSAGVLYDDPSISYAAVGTNEGVDTGKGIDIDGDGITDGYDSDGDGNIDICTYGGANTSAQNGATSGPPCLGSTEALGLNNTPTGTIPADSLTRHPSQRDVVAQVKAELAAQGISFTGSCGSFAIVNAVAWRLRADGAGILEKSGGHRCDVNGTGYSVDVLIFQDGYSYDILTGSSDPGTTGTNGPAWQPGAILDINDWANPIDPATWGSLTLTDH